jgi:hypothetical protein
VGEYAWLAMIFTRRLLSDKLGLFLGHGRRSYECHDAGKTERTLINAWATSSEEAQMGDAR